MVERKLRLLAHMNEVCLRPQSNASTRDVDGRDGLRAGNEWREAQVPKMLGSYSGFRRGSNLTGLGPFSFSPSSSTLVALMTCS